MPRPRTVWLFALARSGSSIAAYASAAPWNLPVADEVLGPWDRTGEPYRYPPSQASLVELFKAEGHALTPAVVDAARATLAEIRGSAPTVISKWPHLRPPPDEWRRAFAGEPAVYLIRNPLHRLNSLHRRGWTTSFGPKQDLDRYRQYARWWLEQPHRVSFDQFKADPRAFFTAVWTGWEFEFTDRDLDAAEKYARKHYHASSKVVEGKPRGAVFSERRFELPREAIDLYLGDPFIQEFMSTMQWSTDPADYGFAPREPLHEPPAAR
ncbi:MAG: hypothetical protein ACF8SC_03140 [Phycisphaerales bacterium JB037]